jgi:hypothetical protein
MVNQVVYGAFCAIHAKIFDFFPIPHQNIELKSSKENLD